MAGLYIHIPFCHSKCAYCDFYSRPGVDDPERYVDALIAEWLMRSHELSGSPTTLYVGGGTPSLMPIAQMRRLIDALPLELVEEMTIEANPEDVTTEWVSAIRELGFNRVSLGVQSLVDAELSAINRRHSANQARCALTLLRRGGIERVSADLIYGLPGQTLDSWRYSLEQLLSLDVADHISAYSLTYEPGTRLHAMLSAGRIEAVGDDLFSAMYDHLTDTLSAHGYEQYEISNFARKDHHSRHNSAYWDFSQYLGLGTSAHSFDGRVRRANRLGVKAYVESILGGKPFFEVEETSLVNLINDYIITTLRTSRGMLFADCVERFGSHVADGLTCRARPYVDRQLIVVDSERMALTREAFAISDAIFMNLMLDD